MTVGDWAERPGTAVLMLAASGRPDEDDALAASLAEVRQAAGADAEAV